MVTENTMDDAQERKEILKNIEEYGCHLILIEGDNYCPAFVYSIGLYQKFGHPEIICFGLKTNVMAAIINHASSLIQEGNTLIPETPYKGFLEGYDIQFLQVEREFYQNYVGYGGWFYNTFDFPLLQLVWPDKNHYFPWDNDFNPDWKFKQPLLDRNTDFKFYEEKNLAVFTTKQAFEGEPILYVYHNEDGDWQFHTSLEPNIDDSKVVSLESITRLDPSINEIYHLQYGWRAWREDIQSDWNFEEYTDAQE